MKSNFLQVYQLHYQKEELFFLLAPENCNLIDQYKKFIDAEFPNDVYLDSNSRYVGHLRQAIVDLKRRTQLWELHLDKIEEEAKRSQNTKGEMDRRKKKRNNTYSTVNIRKVSGSNFGGTDSKNTIFIEESPRKRMKSSGSRSFPPPVLDRECSPDIKTPPSVPSRKGRQSFPHPDMKTPESSGESFPLLDPELTEIKKPLEMIKETCTESPEEENKEGRGGSYIAPFILERVTALRSREKTEKPEKPEKQKKKRKDKWWRQEKKKK